MQLLILNIKFNEVEAWLTLVAIPICIVFIFLAVWSVRHEIHWLQVLFDIVLVAGGGYFGYKLWRIWDRDTKKIYENDRKSLTIFGKITKIRTSWLIVASIALVLMFCTVVVSVICQINFGKGLKRYCIVLKKWKTNCLVVTQKDKEDGYSNVEYELDEETGYRSPAIQSHQGRVLLE